jgi:hypothetical protein
MNFSKEESIVKGDEKVEGGRVLFFATEESLENLARAKAMDTDGTFKSTPKHWYQTMVIGAEISDGNWQPVAYGLLPNKETETYVVFFKLLKKELDRLGLTLSSVYMITDFELALRNAFKEVFPKITLKGCHFHYW